MKNFLPIILIAALLMNAGDTTAQTYNITSDVTLSGSNFPNSCDGCTINISKGVKVTLNMDVYLQNTTVNGGTIEVNNGWKLTIWTNAIFNGVSINIRNTSSFVSTKTLTISNSVFKFYNSSNAVFNSTTQLTNSSMSFTDNASMEATQGNFSLISNSFITVGDGTTTSKAFVKFNGATLNVYDNSYVSLANYNNYYFNWANFKAASKGKSIKTTDNKMNCGNGKNACSSAFLYGPSTLNGTGYSSSAMLPVKLSAMAVKAVNNKVEVTWTTEQEMNSNRFEVERSTDGINWTLAGTVAAKGNSSIASKYIFTDHSKISGAVSYRLKMIDLDETFEYSPIRSLKLAASLEMGIYPNPATSYVVINAKDASIGNVQVQLISYNGQVVKQTSGSGNVTMSVTEFNAGNYFVRVSDAAGAAQTFKLMIVK